MSNLQMIKIPLIVIALVQASSAQLFMGAHWMGRTFSKLWDSPQSPAGQFGTVGSEVKQVPGSAVLRGMAGSNSHYRPLGVPGTIFANVNVLTGQPVYRIPIADVSAGLGVSFPITLTYNGSIRETFDADNASGATSWIGYGWDFKTPYVAVNHRGTVNHSDDLFYCYLGPYGGGELLKNSAGKYFVASNPTIQVSDPEIVNGSIRRWTFQTSSGVRLIFGNIGLENAVRYLVRSGNILTASPYATSGKSTFIYRWDVSRIENYGEGSVAGNNALTFTYDRVAVPITAGTDYTRESYPYEILRKDRLGNIIEKYRFVTEPKDAEEYMTSSSLPAVSQSIYETRKLTRIEHYLEDNIVPTKSYVLNSYLEYGYTPEFPYSKRLLTKVKVELANPRGGIVTDPKLAWSIFYEYGNNRHFALSSVAKPYFGRDEFTYEWPKYEISDWTSKTQQSSSYRRLLKENGTELVLPTSSELIKSKWMNQTSCTELFCFVAAVERDPNDKVFVNVWKNNGNFFKEVALDDKPAFRLDVPPSSNPNSIQLIPWNENLIVVDELGKKLWLYEWDGEKFKSHTNIIRRENSQGEINPVSFFVNNTDRIKVVTGSDFFVVSDKGFVNACDNVGYNHTKLYVVRKKDGVWKDMNEKECLEPKTCPIFSATTAAPSTGCLVYQGVMVGASNTGFSILHTVPIVPPNDLSYAYVFSKKASEDQFEARVAYIPYTNYPPYPYTQYYQHSEPIQFGEDFFLVKSTRVMANPAPPKTWYDIYHDNGTTINKIGTTGEFEGDTKAYSSKDYFVIAQIPVSSGTSEVSLWYKKAVVSGGYPTGLTFVKQSLRSYTGAFAPATDWLVRTHPFAFTVERYVGTDVLKNGAPTRPPVLHEGDYDASLYEFDRVLAAAGQNPAVRVNNFYDEVHSYYDVNFSATDNLVTGKNCMTSTNGTCSGLGGYSSTDKIAFATARIIPGANQLGRGFIRNIESVYNPWGSGIHALTDPGQRVFSNAARLGSECILNKTSLRVEFSLVQSMGMGFTQRPYQTTIDDVPQGDINYVRKVRSTGGITGPEWGHWTEYLFNYTPGMSSLVTKQPEYSTHLQSFFFPATSVYSYRGSEAVTTPKVEAAIVFHHIVDEEAAPLAQSELMKIGLQTNMRTYDMAGSLGSETVGRKITGTGKTFDPPFRESSWPEKLHITRVTSTNDTDFARNGSRRKIRTTFHRHHAESGLPLFTKTKLGNEWFLKQNLFKTTGVNKGIPFRTVTFRFTTEPPDATLAVFAPPDAAYSADGADGKAVSSSEVEFDASFPFLTKKSLGWRDADPTLDDTELKTGTDPIFSLAEGREERSIIERRNAYGQPLETRVLANASGSIDRKSALFYEGRATLPVAAVANAFYEDAAVLTAENGNVGGLATHDWEGRWTKADQGATNQVAHTGRYSIKVVDNYGPTTELRLKGVAGQGYDYVISAWIYCQNPVKPILTAQRFRANGTGLNTIMQDNPIGEAFTYKKWQRYEIKLTNAQLRGSEGLFATEGSNDYLKVKIGTGNPGVSSTRIAFVDDIICRPSQSVFSLTAYNAKGEATHATNNDYLVTRMEYGLLGNLTATRDDKNRILTSSSSHLPGEND